MNVLLLRESGTLSTRDASAIHAPCGGADTGGGNSRVQARQRVAPSGTCSLHSGHSFVVPPLIRALVIRKTISAMSTKSTTVPIRSPYLSAVTVGGPSGT